ncbi:MAG: hypothetical protein ACO1N9_03980 [Flavobacterium sp.]
METDKAKYRGEIIARMAVANPSGTDPNRYKDVSAESQKEEFKNPDYRSNNN